jgi:hypothetical protein
MSNRLARRVLTTQLPGAGEDMSLMFCLSASPIDLSNHLPWEWSSLPCLSVCLPWDWSGLLCLSGCLAVCIGIGPACFVCLPAVLPTGRGFCRISLPSAAFWQVVLRYGLRKPLQAALLAPPPDGAISPSVSVSGITDLLLDVRRMLEELDVADDATLGEAAHTQVCLSITGRLWGSVQPEGKSPVPEAACLSVCLSIAGSLLGSMQPEGKSSGPAAVCMSVCQSQADFGVPCSRRASRLFQWQFV